MYLRTYVTKQKSLIYHSTFSQETVTSSIWIKLKHLFHRQMPLVHSCALAFPRKEMNQTKCNQLSRNVMMYCYFPTAQFCRGGLSYSSRTVVLSFHIHLISCDFILLMYFFVYQTLPN